MKQRFTSFVWGLPALISGFVLLMGLGLAGFFFLSVTETQRISNHNLGVLLSQQLASNSRQPLILGDKLSLQVELSEINDIPGVTRTAVLNQEKQVIAQQGKSGTTTDLVFKSPINLDGKTAGQAVVELDKKVLWAPFQQFLVQVFILWILLSAAVVLLAAMLGRKWSRQLIAVAKKLPDYEGRDVMAGMSEIVLVEQALAPLLVKKFPDSPTVESDSGASSTDVLQTILSIKFSNLSRLRAELSGDNFKEVLDCLDEIISFLIKLYDGKRLVTHSQEINLVFNGVDNESDHCLRALYAGCGCLRLTETLEKVKSLKIECSIAITSAMASPSNNHIESALLLGQQLERGEALLQIASVNEILLDSKTATDAVLDNTALLEPLSADKQMFRCDGLAETAETLVNRQLAFFGGFTI